MTRNRSSHGPVFCSARAASFALSAVALVAMYGCKAASIGNGGTGGNGSGTGPSGSGGAGLGTGVVVDLNTGSKGDAGADRPGGGKCGDGTLQRSEQCDDGNAANDDGCSRICQIEANWDCPTEGQACIFVGKCGSGRLTTNKACDDGNTASGDGCSSDCKTVESGFICRVPGKPCTTRCGDGIIKGFETCDDGNTDNGDGCSTTCKIEPTFDCTGSPSTCKTTVCGNAKKEAGETCDDGNTLPYDGCASNCQSEPKCGTATSAVGECRSTCGDGILWPGMEECDDGNAADGDGCSRECKVEAGWTCKSTFNDPPAKLEIPVIVRDFPIGYSPNDNPPSGHPDFGNSSFPTDDSLQKAKGIVATTLGLDRKPAWAGPTQDPVPNLSQSQYTGKKEFAQWYNDAPGVNQTLYRSLTLLQNATNKTTYAMNSDTDPPWFDLCGFFPIDDLSKPLVDQNTGKPTTYTDSGFPGRTCHGYQGLGFGNSWASHNFRFTTELRYWFQYQGNENLKFTGDDDVWVFINGTMALDLGGIHNTAGGNVTLDTANGTGQVAYQLPFSSPSAPVTVDFKLKKGSVYEAVVFQAERYGMGSNYMLTLANFIGARTQCDPTCGDGVAVGDEECDCGDGKGQTPAGCPGPNSDTTYGGCTKQCKWGNFCGDGTVQAPPDGPEECDKGKDNGDGKSQCSIACQAPRSCGDNKVDTDLGEKCDLGTKNGQLLDAQLQPASDPNDPNAQVFCTTDCTIPPSISY